jgi:uncharacterized protein
VSKQIVSVYRGNELLFTKVKLAGNFLQRIQGLMFHRDFPGIDGLLLFPCKFIHMLGMRFPVDLIYLNRDQKVLYTLDVLVPHKFGPLIKDAYYVLEVQAGVVAIKKIRVGERIRW